MLVTLPQSHQKFATESPLAVTSGKLLTQCFGELKGLPQVCRKLLRLLRANMYKQIELLQ